MPVRVKNVNRFLFEMARLLDIVSTCREVLFRAPFRDNLAPAIEEATGRLRQLANNNDSMRSQEARRKLHAAGLVGPQLKLKLESFESALVAFEAEAGENRLREVLDVGGTILGSLAGAIPGFGSFAQELVEFILKEFKKRWRIWRK